MNTKVNKCGLLAICAIILMCLPAAAQSVIAFSVTSSLRTPLWIGNMEYTRAKNGNNLGFGVEAFYKRGKHYYCGGIINSNESFRDVVRDEWRSWETFDTIDYKSKILFVNMSYGLYVVQKVIALSVEPGIVFGKWNNTIISAFGPKGKVVHDTLNRSQGKLQTGVWLRNGYSFQYNKRRIRFSVNIYNDILIRKYWKREIFLDALEPYPTAAIGAILKVGYILFKEKRIK